MTDDERFTQASLDRLTPIEPSAQLRRMVAQIPIEHPRVARSFWPFANSWLPSLSLAAALVVGLGVGRGMSSLESDPGSPTLAQADSASLGTPSEDLNHPDSNAVTDEGIDSAGNQEDAELDELLILATAGDFAVDDWDLSKDPGTNEPQEGTF